MIALRHIAAALLGVAGLLLTGCDDRFPDYSYKMTVYVGDTPFSTVRHVELVEGASIQDSSGRRVDRKLSGQAVIIEFDDGDTVYGLLSNPKGEGFGLGADYGSYVAEFALKPHVRLEPKGSKADQAIKEYREEQGGVEPYADYATFIQNMVKVKGPVELPRTRKNPFPGRNDRQNLWPMFVTFGDPSDPKTVREVSPGSLGISRITIEITDDDVTEGIEERLGWLLQHRNVSFAGNRFAKDNSLADNLVAGNFSTEIQE